MAGILNGALETEKLAPISFVKFYDSTPLRENLRNIRGERYWKESTRKMTMKGQKYVIAGSIVQVYPVSNFVS